MLDANQLADVIAASPPLDGLRGDPAALLEALNTPVHVPIHKLAAMDADALLALLSQSTRDALLEHELYDTVMDDATNQRYADVRAAFDALLADGAMSADDHAAVVAYITRPRELVQTPVQSGFGLDAPAATADDVAAALAILTAS